MYRIIEMVQLSDRQQLPAERLYGHVKTRRTRRALSCQSLGESVLKALTYLGSCLRLE